MVSKVYEAFARLLNECSQAKLSIILAGFKNRSKQAIQFLLSFLKNHIAEEIYAATSIPQQTLDVKTDLYTLTIKCFHKLLQLICQLSHENNKSKFELKYEINDLMAKLFGPKSQFASNIRRKSIVYTNLKFNFVNTLQEYFSGIELANLICAHFLNAVDSSNEILLRFINEQLFQLDTFDSNPQFRDAIVAHICKHLFNEKGPFSNEQLNVAVNLFKFRSRLSKQNLENLVNIMLKPLIASLVTNFKPNEKANDIKSNQYLVNSFLCLMEAIDVIMTDRVSSKAQQYLIQNDENILSSLFEIVLYYFRCEQFSEVPRPHLWFRVNSVILELSKFIQKHIERYLITNRVDEMNDLTNSTTSTYSCDSNVCNEAECLVRGFIEMLFGFIDAPAASFCLTFKMKLEATRSLMTFWKCLNINLKRSVSLNDFLLKHICQSFLVNFYFKLYVLRIQQDGAQLRFSSFMAKKTNTNICLFYENLLRFLSDLFCFNCKNFEHFRQFILLNLVSSVIKRTKRRVCPKDDMTNVSTQILSSVENLCKMSKITLFKSELNQTEMFRVLGLGAQFNLLKDEASDTSISIIEKFLLICQLLKQIDQVSSDNKLFSNMSLANESKRRIKMNLLDELYALHKLEKNYLHMSFVRKEQVNLNFFIVNHIQLNLFLQLIFLRLICLNGTIIEKAQMNRTSKKFYI